MSGKLPRTNRMADVVVRMKGEIAWLDRTKGRMRNIPYLREMLVEAVAAIENLNVPNGSCIVPVECLRWFADGTPPHPKAKEFYAHLDAVIASQQSPPQPEDWT